MIEIYKNLFVGNQEDYEFKIKEIEGWSVIHACKEPYHRNLLGYSGRGAPKNHPEYLIAKRNNRLFLNLVDANNPAYIPKEIIDTAIKYIRAELDLERKVLVHCNQGMSRSPGIGMLYLANQTNIFEKLSFQESYKTYLSIYPNFNPAGGVMGFIKHNWNTYAD